MKNKIMLLTLIALSATYGLRAQSLQWAYVFGKAGDPERALAMTTDAQGYVYTAGFFKDTLDFDPGPDSVKSGTTGYGQAFILKMDAAGNYIQHQVFGYTTGGNKVTAGNIRFDAAGNLYTAGYFTGSNVDFDPDTSVKKISAAGSGNNAFLMKMDNTGKFLWVKNWNYNRDAGGAGSTLEEGPVMSLDAQGDVIMAGRFTGTVDFDPGTGITKLTAATENGYISRFDPDGNFRWVKQLKVDTPVIKYLFPRSVATDASGNIYVAGNFIGNADFDPDTLSSHPVSTLVPHGFVVKLDSTGNLLWVKKIGSDASPMLNRHSTNAVITDAAGNAYITGSYMETVSFDNIQLTSAGLADIYVAKLDPSGNYLWVRSAGSFFDGELGYRLDMDAAGNLYVAGTFRGTVDFNPGPGTSSLTTNGAADVFVWKLTSGGDHIWVKGYGGPDGYEQIQALTVNGGDIYTAGRMISTMNFDPNGYYYQTSGSANTYYPDFYIHKMSQDPAGIAAISGTLEANIFPNPAKDLLHITLAERTGEASVTILDLQGRTILKDKMKGNTTEINTAMLSRGYYLVKIQSGDRYAAKKLIVQ